MGKQSAKKRERKQEAQQSAPKSKTHTEVKRPYTVMDCVKLGRTGNILFVVFIVICLIYYYSFANKGNYIIPFEILAYAVESIGFALFAVSIIWLDRLVRARGLMKTLLLVYIITEVGLMLLEFDFIFPNVYNGLSLPLTIGHSIFSAGVVLSMLALDPSNKKMEAFVIITCTIMLAGMFLGLAGYRVYASILLNAFAYIFFFSAIQYQLHLDELDIDCYGDKAPEAKFDSTMFADTPLLVEKPKKEPQTLRQRLEHMRDTLTSEEHIVLTDTDEKFDYEFGADADKEPKSNDKADKEQ